MRYVIKTLFFTFILLYTHLIYVMEEPPTNPNQYAIEYEPWRDKYLSKTHDTQQQKPENCVFCTIPTKDPSEERILLKGKHCYLTLNLNPHVDKGYSFLLIPYQHEKQYFNLSAENQKEMDDLTHFICNQLSQESDEIHSFYNVGQKALATIPNHLHQHIVCKKKPRCFNLIQAIEESTSPVDIQEQYQQLLPLFSHSVVPFYALALFHHQYDADCYYCAILQQNDDKKNLVIHQNEHITVLFDHHSFTAGDVIIIPNNHYTNRIQVPAVVLTSMRNVMAHLYPLLLSLFNAEDVNLGMVTYGDKSTNKQHIRYQITPRLGIPFIHPTTHTIYIPKNIPALCATLRKEFNDQQ